MLENTKKRAINSATYQTIGGMIQIAIRLAGSMVLARLLTPADLGIFALTTLIIGLFSQITLLGAPQAVVAKRCISQNQLNSVFILNIIINSILAVIIFTASSYIASFYNEAALSTILKIISIVIFIKAFGSVPNSLLTKAMKFHYVNAIAIIAAIIEMGVAIVLVIYYGYNFWALVWGLVAAEISMTLLLILAAQWKPTKSISLRAIGYYLRYGFHLVGENITTYFRQNIDYFVIGKLLGANALGIYSFAYRIPNLVNARLFGPASGVIMPYMSKLTNDEQIIQAYLTFTKFIAYAGFLLLLILFILAKPIILLMWGEQWHDAIDPMKVLVFASASSMLGLPLGSVFLKKSRPDLLFKTAIIKLPVTLILVLGMGYIGGIMGIAYAMALSAVLAFIISFIYLKKIVQISTYEFLKNILPATVNSILAAITVTLFSIIMPDIGYFLEIIIISTIIVLIYISLTALLFHKDYLQIKNLLQKYIKKGT
jgi:PST family polysaccharide transporter